jgi:serine/threonine-protein kinase
MAEDRNADAGARAPGGSTLPLSEEKSPGGSTGSADSLLRAAAQISEEPSLSEVAMSTPGPSLANLAGEILAKRYRLEREIGRGGMGVVWEATHLVTRRRVAIKFVLGPANRRTDLRRRFIREARAASAANHPNVVVVNDVFELDDGTPVMVMELLTGETLRERLVREPRLTLEATASIVLPVVAAVGTAHALGIVHRDLKPENIFLLKGAEPGADVKVLDFGVAKLIARDGEAHETDPITGTGSALGTPCYMAPEQTIGDKAIDGRADIWALGVIIYECLAGVRPVAGLGIGQVVMKLMTEGIKPLDQLVPDLPPAATALVMRMLGRERDDRPRDLREVHEVLAAFTHVNPRPFDAPRVTPPIEPDESPDPGPPRTLVVDPQAPRSLPSGPGRSWILGVAAAATLLLTASIVWRAIAPDRAPLAAERPAQNANDAPRMALPPTPSSLQDAPVAVAPEASASASSAALPNERATSHLAREHDPAGRPHLKGHSAGSAPPKVDGSAASPSPAPSAPAPAKPRATPGLAEEAPF